MSAVVGKTGLTDVPSACGWQQGSSPRRWGNATYTDKSSYAESQEGLVEAGLAGTGAGGFG